MIGRSAVLSITPNYDGSVLDLLPSNIIDSTSPSESALIRVRDNNIIIQELRIQ